MSIYGILISLSIFISIKVVQSLVEHEEKEKIWDVTLWLVIGGVLGARIYHVLSDLDFYMNNPIQIIQIYKGGLAFYGALMGGFISLCIYLRNRNKNISYYMDLILTAIPLAHAIGRFGNYFNQEAYGKETNMPWAILVNGKKVHPLFLYESLLDILNFILIYSIVRKHKNLLGSGIPTAIYLMDYGIIRFTLEFLRPTSWTIGVLNVAQAISILLFIYGSIYLIRSRGIWNKK